MEEKRIIPGTAGAFNAIISAVVSFRHVSRAEIIGYCRAAQGVWARHETCYLMRRFTNFSLPQIAGWMGNRDHTTVWHSCHTVTARMLSDPTYAAEIGSMVQKLEPAMAPILPRDALLLRARHAVQSPADLLPDDVRVLACGLLSIASFITSDNLTDDEARTASLTILNNGASGAEPKEKACA